MLRKMEPQEFSRYVEYAWRISQSLCCSAFPVYTDGIKTKAWFVERSRRGMERPNEEILLYEQDGAVRGWAHYYWEEENRYVGPVSILVEKEYGRALGELLRYWDKRLPGYGWHMYFPQENKEALAYMKGRGFQDLSQENVDVLLFADYTPQPEGGQVVKIGPENFGLFQQVHQRFEEGMYWTSDRIARALERWVLFGYMEGGACLGVLFYMYMRGSADLEIFGVDVVDEEAHPQAAKGLLLGALNHAKAAGARSMYFFNEGKLGEAALELGFRRVTTAHYFEGELGC